MDAETLADKIAPKLQALLKSRRSEIIKAAGTIPGRTAVFLAFPIFVDEVPVLTRAALDLIREEFGKMDLNDLLNFLNQNAKGPQ